MGRKLLFLTLLAILLMNLLGMAIKVETVKASGTIYIRADGSIDPSTAPISTVDNITYTLTGNINGSIVLMRSHIILDGNGYIVQSLSEGATGIGVYGTTNVTIKNFEIIGFSDGIVLYYNSTDSCVEGNNIMSSINSGIVVGGQGNKIFNNYILASGRFGIFLSTSTDNYIYANTLADNWIAMHLTSMIEVLNFIYHNNFIDNLFSNYVHIDNIEWVWDDGYPSGGNFWSHYDATDLYSGSYQNETGSDGIADSPYLFDGYHRDNYPLMRPYMWWNLADVNYDFKVNIFDVVLACGAYVSTPSDPNWNPHCDIAEPYGVIDIFDIMMICSSYGEEYTP